MEIESSYLVDSHCHLNFKDFEEDFDSVIQRAKDSNVQIMVSISTELEEIDHIIKISESYNNIYCTVGVHPHSAKIQNKLSEDFLIERASNPKVIGIGETGLDFYYENSLKEDQIDSFIKHINVSRETQLPLIIHTREADEKTCEILESEYKNGSFPGIIHCFTAGANLAKRVIDLGFYISLSGIVTFKNASDLRETIKKIPLDRIIVETDSPYLSPEPLRGKRNEPSHVLHTAKYLADFYGKYENDFFAMTTDNFFKIFNKANRL